MYKRPSYLQRGDEVVIIAPAGRIKEGGLDQSVLELKKWGLKVTIGKHALDGYNYFSGTDQGRLKDLQSAINSPKHKAIFCARGGYGLTRIIDQIDFSELKVFPKWITGFSDVTTLHLALAKHEIQSIHSLMPTGFESADERSIESLRKILFGESIVMDVDPSKYNKYGQEEASLIGGNLSLLSASIGTKYELHTAGKILFIEEIDEYLYKVDRMLGQLSRSGKLSKLKGLIIGQMSQMKDTAIPFGINVQQLILDHVSQYDYPVLFNMPIGHQPLNLPVVQEGIYQLDVNERRGILKMI